MNVEGSRGEGRPKNRWLDTINMRTAGVSIDDVIDRVKKRFRIRVPDLK